MFAGGVRMGSAPLRSPGRLSGVPGARSPQGRASATAESSLFSANHSAQEQLALSHRCADPCPEACGAAGGPGCPGTPCPALWGWVPTPPQPQQGEVCTHLANLPVWGTPRMVPHRWCLAPSPGSLEYFVIDIIWRIFAYFGNLTNWKEMSPRGTESLHESPQAFKPHSAAQVSDLNPRAVLEDIRGR